MAKPLRDTELMLARAKAKRMAKQAGKPVCLVRNRLWDSLWNGPARAVEAPSQDDDVLVRDTLRTPQTAEISDVYANVRAEAPQAAAARDRLVRALVIDGDREVSPHTRIEVFNALADHLVIQRGH